MVIFYSIKLQKAGTIIDGFLDKIIIRSELAIKKKSAIKADSLFLKLSVLRCPWERYHVPYVAHTGHEEHQALKAKPETAVYCRTKTAGIKVPPQLFLVNAKVGYLLLQYIKALFPLRTTYDFTYAREQYVHGTYGLVIVVQPHIEGLYFGRVIK